MKLNWRGWLAGIVLGTTLQAVAQEGRNVVHSASGGGHRIFDAELRTFAFHAVQYSDGSVAGEVEIVNRDQGNRIHGTVRCLRVVGNEAVVILEYDEQSAFPGSLGIFAVRDNGEGRSAEPDQITYAYNIEPPLWDCEVMLEHFWHLTFHVSHFPLLPIEKGNLQVK